MKKILFIASTLLFCTGTMLAQDISKNAIGLRLGDNDGFGTEVSYQRHLKANNRLEFDLGWRSSRDFDAFKLVGLYQWLWNIDKGFNWFAGVGAGVGAFDAGNNVDGSFALVAGDIGIEYNFDIPLILSLDLRPEIGFNNDFNDGIDWDLGLGIRYQF